MQSKMGSQLRVQKTGVTWLNLFDHWLRTGIEGHLWRHEVQLGGYCHNLNRNDNEGGKNWSKSE